MKKVNENCYLIEQSDVGNPITCGDYFNPWRFTIKQNHVGAYYVNNDGKRYISISHKTSLFLSDWENFIYFPLVNGEKRDNIKQFCEYDCYEDSYKISHNSIKFYYKHCLCALGASNRNIAERLENGYFATDWLNDCLESNNQEIEKVKSLLALLDNCLA